MEKKTLAMGAKWLEACALPRHREDRHCSKSSTARDRDGLDFVEVARLLAATVVFAATSTILLSAAARAIAAGFASWLL